MSTAVNDRIDIRINKQQKELIRHAAELKGFKSVSEFVVFCINAEAGKIIEENNTVLKTIEDKKIFLNAILNPPAPNQKLITAQERFNAINSGK